MSDWVHCNICFNQPGKSSNRKFVLTNCGHVYCDVCVKHGAMDKCKMCGSKCTTIVLSAKMKPDVEIFFSDTSDIARKHLKELLQVMEFQKSHRKRLSLYLREKAERESNIMEQMQMSVAAVQDLQRENNKLREENIYLKKLISDTDIHTSRRNSSVHGSGGYRASPLNKSLNPSPRSVCSKGSPRSAGTSSRQCSRGAMNEVFFNSIKDQSADTPTLNRILLRTPPSHGHIGVMPSSGGTPNYLTMNSHTPGTTGALV